MVASAYPLAGASAPFSPRFEMLSSKQLCSTTQVQSDGSPPVLLCIRSPGISRSPIMPKGYQRLHQNLFWTFELGNLK